MALRNPTHAVHACNVFQQLAVGSWNYLAKARRLGYQPGEETLTDLNVLALKDLLPGQVKTITFTKPQEGVNGADWEWWFTGASRKWIGFRVQAKILNLRSDRYEHLHYQKKDGTWQVDNLINVSLSDNLIPLYCLYLETPWVPPQGAKRFRCGTFSSVMKHYGCSLLSAFDVRALRPAVDLPSVFPHTYPWHCLVCCPRYGSADLPHRVFDFWQRTILGREISTGQSGLPNPTDDQGDIYRSIDLREEPPSHVSQLIEGQLDYHPDPEIRGVFVVTDTEFSA